jgi:hypothetical protein
MRVLLVPKNTVAKVNGKYNGIHAIECGQDADGNYILPIDVLDDDNFEEIKDILLKLKQIEFNPKIYAE